jgi:myo-inositol-1(or 4)-monophosphatase
MDAATLNAWRTQAEVAARRGGAELEQMRTTFAVREKGRNDLVTDADVAAQRAVRNHLLSAFPDHGFLGEEDVAPAAPGEPRPEPRVANDAPPTWIVDPLDGTTNYVHDLPAYCVSIGLYVAGALVVGVIFDPRQNELFSAAHGQGATLNGRPIRVSTVATVAEALLATGFTPNPIAQANALRWWEYLSFHAQSLRRTGSTALNLAYLAAGRFDGYWAFDNYPWDMAAGAVLVREAGGQVARVDGTPFDPFKPDIAISNGHIQAELLRFLQTGPA